MQKTPIINESGLYALIFGSRLLSAKKFKHWITSEVLPAIRKTGSYMTKQAEEEFLQKSSAMLINNAIPTIIDNVTNKVSDMLAQYQAWNTSWINKIQNDIGQVLNATHKPITYADCTNKINKPYYPSEDNAEMNKVVEKLCLTGLYEDRNKAISQVYNLMKLKRGVNVAELVNIYRASTNPKDRSAFKIIGSHPYLSNCFIDVANEMLAAIQMQNIVPILTDEYKDIMEKIKCDGYRILGIIAPVIYKRIYSKMRYKYGVNWNLYEDKGRAVKNNVELQRLFVRAFADICEDSKEGL